MGVINLHKSIPNGIKIPPKIPILYLLSSLSVRFLWCRQRRLRDAVFSEPGLPSSVLQVSTLMLALAVLSTIFVVPSRICLVAVLEARLDLKPGFPSVLQASMLALEAGE